MEPIERKYLAGLKYRGAERKVTEENGRKKQVGVPFERALRPEDVLSWADLGDSVQLVTADGRKYTVAKKAAAEK